MLREIRPFLGPGGWHLYTPFWMCNRLTVGERKTTFMNLLDLVQPFWRPEPFNSVELELIDKLFTAHYGSSFRDNVSTVVLRNTMLGSGDFSKAVAAAILTIGAKHAPIEDTIEFLQKSIREPGWVENYLEPGEPVPGWGSSFHKNEPDPLWKEVENLIDKFYPKLGDALTDVTATLHERKIMIFPNPSAYTACVALALDMPPALATYLFIAARLSAWARIVFHDLTESY